MNFLSQLVQQSNLYLLTVVQGSEGWHGAERVSSDFVTELKFTCPTHSEAKQTETSVLGAEEGLLQGQARTVVAALPNAGAPWRFRWEVSTGKIGGWGVGCRCVTLFWLAGGEITGRVPGILKPPSSTWAGASVPAGEPRGTVPVLLHEEPGSCPTAALLLLDCFSFLHSLPFLLRNCFHLPFGTQGRSLEAEWSPFPANKERGTQKRFVPWSPTSFKTRFASKMGIKSPITINFT